MIDKDLNISKIKDHHQDGKYLKTPFNSIGPLSTVSRKDNKLPELMRLALICNGLDREEYLDFFRKLLDYLRKEKLGLEDVTHTEIFKLDQSKKDKLFQFINGFDNINEILQPILLLSNIPEYGIWPLKMIKENNDLRIDLGDAILKVWDHQSESATDIRWFRLMFFSIVTQKISFPSSMTDKIQNLYDYPKSGDLRKVRPFIRATEIGLPIETDLAKLFWDFCLKETTCIPPKFTIKTKNVEYNTKELQNIYRELLAHFFNNCSSTANDPKFEVLFGMIFYSLSLFHDILVSYDRVTKATINMIIRSLVEVRINLGYLISKNDDELRKKFRRHGTGKAKLAFLKLLEMKDKPQIISEDFLLQIMNEDGWHEFVDVNIGQWCDEDLRKMAVNIGLKGFYDKYYDRTSEYIHGKWGAIREQCFTVCINPVHRFHRIPRFDINYDQNCVDDAILIINQILLDLDIVYPAFRYQINI